MKITVAVISDLHAAEACSLPHLRGDIADVLLLRAVHQINRWIKPDVTVFLGDVVDDGDSPAAQVHLQRARQIVELLKSPLIVIPGNHDGDINRFYEIFPRPAETVDIKGVRFVVFIDPEEPGFNARRTARDLERLKAARQGHPGPIVSLQHVPIFPPGRSDCPYNFTNADEIISIMKSCGYLCTISGHYHRGMDLIKAGHVNFLAAPAMCESPFCFLQIDINGDDIQVTKHRLALDERLGLVDCHIHTQLAYCSENMDAARSLSLAKDLGLAGVGFCEHSAQLYFDLQACEARGWLADGLASALPEHNRMNEYFALVTAVGCRHAQIGLEADCDYSGRLVLKAADRKRAGFITGAIHRLAECANAQPDYERACDEFLARLQKLLGCGIKVLAHPFRVFQRAGLLRDQSAGHLTVGLFDPVVRMLREAGVAAEINFHTQQPPAQFVRLCLEADVKLTFGSDSHNLYEIGFFVPHLQLLRDCGYDGDLKDILVDPTSNK